MGNIRQRLEALERATPGHLVIEAVIDGQTQRMTATELAKSGRDFSQFRIISGSDLRDLDLLLGTITARAWEEVTM